MPSSDGKSSRYAKKVVMMTKKTFEKKKRLGKATRQNKRLPVFVAVRTKRKVTQNSKRRTWRTQKLKARQW